MTSYTMNAYLNGYGHQDHRAPPIVQPGQTLPRIDTSRLITPIVVREESDVRVSVRVAGRPSPKVTWYIGESTLSPSVEYQMKQKGNVHSLTILNVSEEVEEGLFVAASNVVGKVKKKIDIKLYKVLSKHKPRERRTWHSHRYTDVIRRPKTTQAPQRFKSFGSFGQFDTLIDGDSDDEVVEDLDEKLYATLCRYKSTPNIRKIPSAENRRATYDPDVCHEKSNYRTRCQTLPNLLDTLADGIRRQLTKSTEAIHNELIIKSIPAFEMDFDGFSSQHSSAHIPEPPLREEGSSSLNDSDFYLQYNRNAQRSVSTFLPQDDMEDTPGMKQSPASSFRRHLSGDGDVQWDVDKAQLASYGQDAVRDYHPEHIREPRARQQDTSLESAGNTNNSSWKQTSYVLEHHENVLAGNLKKASTKGKQQDYPQIAPKPKVKKTKKTKNTVTSGTSDVASAESGLHTYENFGSLQSAGESLQLATDRLQEGFHPDHSSSAVLYAPDGTMFKLPMTGEYDPNLVLGARQDRENTTNLSEQHSFAILPNESINLSQGDGIQSNVLRVFPEENQADKPIKVKSKSGKRVKKKSTSSLKDNVGVNASDVDNSTVQGEYGASYSRSYHQTNTSPGIPHDYSSQSRNVYENIHEMNLSHQSGDPDMLQTDRQRGISGQYYPSNTSFDTSYPKGSASLCEFDPDHHSSNIASGASIHSVPVTPTSPGTSSIMVKQTNPRRNFVKSIPVTDAASLPVSNLPDQYFPTSIGEAAAAEDDYMPGSGHRVGGRRPAQPPPPPPSSSFASPPPEMYLSNPTKLSHYNQQLTSQPASPDQICISDLDAIVPMSTDEMQQSQPESVHLDYSVPMEGQDAVSKTKVRKSPHRKGDSSSQVSDGSSLPKKPKVAKKPKQIKQKSLDTNYSTPSGLPQQPSSWQDNDMPQQPKETNIDDIFQTPSADVQQEMHISQHVKRVKRMKNRSRSRDAPEMSMPVEEVWIDEAPSVLKESNSYTLEQQPDVPDSPFTSSDIANASTPKMIKKKAPHSFSDGSLAPASGQLEAVEINIDNAAASSLPRGVGVWETDIDAADAEPTAFITGRALPGESKKVKKVVKKKKKITKSVGDISSLVEPSMQTLNAQILETDIDGTRIVSEEPVEGAAGKIKTGKKKKKLNKSTGDINADLVKELVDIDIQLTENEKPKKKIKKKVTKSVGDLSQDLTSDGRLVNVDSSLPLHSFNDTQTLEQPKKKVKKVRKKTKSMGDLTSEEAMSVSVINIDIDDGQKECVKDGVHPVEKKKKKKKSLKSQAADGAPVGTDEKQEALMGTSRETCIDDMFSERSDQQAVLTSFSHETCIDDVMAPRREVQQAPYETCIDDVLPQTTEVQLTPRGETYETFIDDVLPHRMGQSVVQMGAPHETCIDEILPQTVQKENPPKETCIDDLFPQMAEKELISVPHDYGSRDIINAKSFPPSSTAQSEKENLYENINQLSYNINSFKIDSYDDSQKGIHEFGAEEMDALPESCKQQNVDQYMPEITETNVDVDFYDPLPVSSHQGQIHEAGDLFVQPKCLEQEQNIDQSADQRLYAKETTIDDVFDGTQITSSPQEPSMELTASERWPEKPKKVKKKRSKSVERGKILQEDGTLLQSQLSLDSDKKVKKKKKKLTKSTGDLTDVGRVVVDIDIDTPSTKIQEEESAAHHPIEGGTATKKVKKVKKKSITTSSMSEEIPNFDQNGEPVAASLEPDPDEKKKKKKVVKKKLHKSTGDLHMLPASLVPRQEIFVDNTEVTATSTVVEPGGTEDGEKKKKRVVKKKVKKSTITVEETNVDDLVTTKMAGDGPSRLHNDDDDDVVMTSSNIIDVGVDSDQRPTSQEKKKRKVTKKSKMKSTSDLTDLSTMEVALVQETETSGVTVNGSAFPEPTALSGADPTVKKKKKVVKKKINKSLSDLTQSGSSNLAGMEIAFTQEADIGGISETVTPIRDPVGVPETDLMEKKKKKVVKRKKLNKSLSDLSQLQSSTLVNFSALDEPISPQTDNTDVTMTATPAQDTVSVTLIDGSEKKRKRVVKKKKANKSLSDLNEPLPCDVNLLINDPNVPAMMECSTDGSMPPSAGIVKEDVPKKRRTVKKKKSVGDQIDAIATIPGVDTSDVQQIDDAIIIKKGMDIDRSVLEEAQMTPIMQQEEAQTVVDEFNTEPLPSASNLDDIFLDKETMNTVVGDVLVGSTLKDNSRGDETIGPYKDHTGKSQPPRDMSIILPAAQSIDIAGITPMTDAVNILPDESSHQIPLTCINQTMENTEIIERDYQDKRKKSKKEKLVTSQGDASAEIPSLIVSNKENKKTKKKKKTSLDVVSDVIVEPMLSLIDISDIPLIDSDISDSVFEQRLNELNGSSEKTPFPTETRISPVVEQGKSIGISPDRYEKKYPDLTVKQAKTIDVVVDELNNNTAELGSETIRTSDGGDIHKQLVTCSTDVISQLPIQPLQEYKSDKGLPDGHSFPASQLSKISYEAFKKPEAISIFHTSGTRQLSSETDQSSESCSTEPMDGASDRVGSIPVKVHRKKNYTPVQYRPWTDILFGTAKPKIKVTRKEPPSTERSLNSSFVDSSFDSQVEKWSDGKTSYTTEISDGIPAEVRSEPTGWSQDEMERDGHQKEQPRIERKSSMRKQTKSLENLLNAEEDDGFGMTTYNKYEDLDDDESTRNRIRTKSVDNLTLLQQRQRQIGAERSIENKREHSKSTGCLLEGRIAKLARKTLTQELLYETVTTVEEVVVIKRPLDAAAKSPERKESGMTKPKEPMRSVSGKERRYLGSLVIVDIYDDKESATESSAVDVTDESRESNYLTDTSMIQSSIGTIVSDFRRSSSASEKNDTSQELSRHDDDTSSVRSSNISTETYPERQTMTDISNKELLTCDRSVDVVETCLIAKVSDVDVQKEESQVVAIQAKEVPVDVSPVHLQVIGQSSTAEVKTALSVDPPVVIVTETCTIKHDVATLKQSVEISKDEGTQVNLEELQQYAEPKRESQEFSQQTPEERVSKEFSQQTPEEIVVQEFSQQIPEESSDDDDDEDDDDDTSDDSATATDGESGDSYDAEDADSSMEGRGEAEADAEVSHQVVLDAIVEEDQETDKEETNLAENIHTTMITITEEITTIKSSAANTETTVCLNDQFGSESDGTLSQNGHAESLHILNISLQSESNRESESCVSDQSAIEPATRKPASPTAGESRTNDSFEIQETQESSMVCSEHESSSSSSSEEDVDVILPPRETGLKESWEEVVTYEYEYDKETGVKKIILKPKVIENRTTEFFSYVDEETVSPSKRQTSDSEMTEIEPESVIVYEYGEMISMYSDTTVSDIYLNNSLELGSSGAEGAYAGVERAIDIMVSRELRSAISEVTGQPLASASDRETTASSPVTTEDCHDNQEPLPVHQAAVEIPTDIEIDTAQMTPNLKRAVELLRNKYNIVKMSREATPIPQELVEDSQLGEGCTINNEPLPQGTGYYVDDQMMDEVQDELETVMIELNKMDLARTIPLKSKVAHQKEGSWTETKIDRSGSESSDTDTLVETVPPCATEKQHDGDRNDDTGDDDDDDETSGENMIFDMDDVFVKVVTTKDGRIKKIKILEGKEGGDTKKIVSPNTDRPFVAGDDDDDDDDMAAASTEQSRVSDQQYFTKMFYQEDFLAGDEQYESGSAESDELNERRTGPREEGSKGESSEPELARHGDDHETGEVVTDSYFERISETVGSYYQDYDVRNLPDDHSTDSETSDDDDDDDDEEYYEEDDERESPMRSLSPIAEEADGHEVGVVGLPSSSSTHQRQTITDSSEEDDEDEDPIEDSDGYVEVQRAERLSPQLIRQLSESQEDLEILKEFVRNAASSPSEESDHNSCGPSPSASSVAHHQRATPTDGSGQQASTVGKESITRLATSQSPTSGSTSSDPDIDSESDIITQKLALEGFLSSLDKESSSSC